MDGLPTEGNLMERDAHRTEWGLQDSDTVSANANADPDADADADAHATPRLR